MLEQHQEDRDEGRALRLALDVMWQASRHKRASRKYEDLIFDLEMIETKNDELLELLRGGRIVDELVSAAKEALEEFPLTMGGRDARDRLRAAIEKAEGR